MLVFGAVVVEPGDTGPRNLEYGAHRHAGGASVQRITAGGCDQHGIHIERGRRTHQCAHIGVVHDVFHYCHAAGALADLGYGGQRPASHRA